jgi:predicted RND superfamily exporter protein
MWKFFAGILLRNKLVFTLGILLGTVFMGYEASKMELSYEFAKILPDNDPTFIDYQNFKKQFGEDGNVMVLGFEDKNFFSLQKFNDWYYLSKAIKVIPGIKDVLSVPTIFDVVKNDSLEKLEFVPLITKIPTKQSEVDAIKERVLQLPFYQDIVYNKANGANLMAITFNKASLNSALRLEIVKEIKILTDAFATKHNIAMHYSGMPYIRTQMMEKISHEMTLFLILAIIITGFILWLFFRSGVNVFFSLIIVAIGVVWSIGLLQLFGYKITVLTGLIAPLIMVIGIPNCIFLINKYQSEFLLHRNRIKALTRMIVTIGITLFLANVTTAIGFGVLYFTKSSMLVEFGMVAGLAVIITYFITLILIPVILFLLPAPKAKHTKHLEGKRIRAMLSLIDRLVHQKRATIYAVTSIVTAISIIGIFKIELIGYVVDDLPKNDPVYTDLHFFEHSFKGVLPFEISLDTKKEKGLFSENARAIYKIKLLQAMFAEYPEFSKPISIAEAIKFSYQAYKGGDPKYYRIPSITDLKTLSEYSGSLNGQNNNLNKFIDSTRRITRISFQMADIGSKRIKELTEELKPRIDSIFDPKEYKVSMTGHSLVFLKSNDYLLYNLFESLIIEIILIALVGMVLFRSISIIVLSKIPCLIPLVITAGVMGFLNIRFKPSTILIFSIAFGISSDGTVYLLTKYRQELRKNGGNAVAAISEAIRDTGLSMVYTTVILFFGFSIFSVSSFGGTAALGILISLTLIISLFTNLILLPAILLSINNKRQNKIMAESSLIEVEEDEGSTPV